MPAQQQTGMFGYTPRQNASLIASQQPQQAAPSTQGSISTSVTPGGVYSPQQTQWGVNQARANADQMADPRWQQKQFMTPGRSMDQGTMGAAIPGIANALFTGQQQAASTPLNDAFANQQQMLSGQIGQQQEGNALMNMLAGYNENNIAQRQALINQNLSPLLSMLGGGLNFGA